MNIKEFIVIIFIVTAYAYASSNDFDDAKIAQQAQQAK